jgi:hypothetical protein
MNVCLKFYGLGINDIMQAHIIISSNNNIVYEGDTYNGEIFVCLDENSIYKLYAYSYNEEINLFFYVDRLNYYFYFPRSYIRIITFKLLDYFYGNPIGKGELILWQK